MMPLTMAEPGAQNSIKRVSGQTQTRQFLESLGFVPGTDVTVITEISGNMIVNVRESRVAISREMAARIMV
jgi:ferrous iron transport protein A